MKAKSIIYTAGELPINIIYVFYTYSAPLVYVQTSMPIMQNHQPTASTSFKSSSWASRTRLPPSPSQHNESDYTYVNPKQFHRILKRRAARKKLGLSARRPYHESTLPPPPEIIKKSHDELRQEILQSDILRLARRTIEETESYLQRSSSSTQCLPTNEVLDNPIYIGFNETITAMFEASGDQATETPINYDAFINLDDFILPSYEDETKLEQQSTPGPAKHLEAGYANPVTPQHHATSSCSPPLQIRTFYDQCCSINKPPKSSVGQRHSNRQGARKNRNKSKARNNSVPNDTSMALQGLDGALESYHTVADGPPTTVTASPVQCPIVKSPGNPPLTIHSFVPGMQQKRPRRRHEEIEGIYKCGWEGCEKAYGTLRNLNTHISTKSHGLKWKTKKEWSISQAPSHQPCLHLQKPQAAVTESVFDQAAERDND